MKRVYRIDLEGFYVEDVILEDEANLPSDCIDMPEPIGFYKIKYDAVTKKWVEGLSQEEIDVIRNATIPPTEIERLNEQMDYLVDVDFRLSLVELGL
ncbi:hypothetical protein [Bacillus sp. AFS017336]|uniref:hypothetical protein n=1 Tax=Bacillus sp. AFS017336 TaxID=2033489 RepID=UPI000BEF985E|nr:hypothetical protein [Bacillus sp. AFS017336]PEL12657.1 hypothetical protein CN601_06835 [Bacillus sp. AFS017336]